MKTSFRFNPDWTSICGAIVIAAMLLGGATPAMAQSAPPITNFEITGVRSPNVNRGSWVRVGAGDFQTAHDHGGQYLDIEVRCMGYASASGATMASFSMTYQGRSPITDSRNRIIGYYFYYRLSRGLSSGNVSVWATSIKTGRRWSDALTIR